ncbi:myozenin-1a isoform X2 [Scleropages formosus]|uniref:Myozenin 1a n=1 Tax=Scleropages formosus TaxID=113540 RepID=A0A8C9SG69_SCLFO|nr:myozenin-1 isoform X2 [Scleropages formosus]
MPLSGTPAPIKRKKSSRIITDFSHITQDEYESEPEASEFDLGPKISTPKDIMLEELSLLKNKGSKMFKMRQLRVEKFIYENNPDVFTSESMENFQKLVPTLGGQMMDVGGHIVRGQMVGHVGRLGRAPIPPPKPGSLVKGVLVTGAGGSAVGVAGAGGAGGAGGLAGGAGGQGAGGQGGGTSQQGGTASASDKSKKKCEYVKTYISPWERAMKGNAELMATMKAEMPGPIMYRELPKYKCFNRSAMPYGGFEKATQLMTFQLPEVDVAPVEPQPAVVYQQDIGSRPSFNRTPIGWVGSGETSHIHVEVDTIPFDGETDDL